MPGEGQGDGGGGRTKKRKMKLMDESKQTAQERRALRLEQRKLRAEVIEQQADIGDPTKTNMQEVTEKNHRLFRSVKYPREAVQDGETMKLIASAASEQVKKVANSSVGTDLDDFLHKLKTVFSTASGAGSGSSAHFNWSKLGGSVSMVFLSAPAGGGFMMGPLDKPLKEARSRQRRNKPNDDNVEEVEPEDVAPTKGKHGSKQKKDQTHERITRMRDQVATKGLNGKETDMFETLLNPKSFTQTVENLFDFSFLVKNGQGAISLDEGSGLPRVTFNGMQSGSAEGASSSEGPKQWLMSFGPADFRELTELYGLKEPHFKHRDEGPTSDYFDPLVHGNRDTSRQ
ncbi:unnamed protein product [Ascophyllum nodosum]